MHIESEWAKVPYTKAEVLSQLKDLHNLKQWIPNAQLTISPDGKKCQIKIDDVPMEIKLKQMNDPEKDGYLKLSSESMPFSFDLLLEVMQDTHTKIRATFDGKSINMFIKPMIEKPIRHFLGKLAQQIEKYFAKP